MIFGSRIALQILSFELDALSVFFMSKRLSELEHCDYLLNLNSIEIQNNALQI